MERKPLAEFLAPVEDTLNATLFDVDIMIRTFTGAPKTAPSLCIETSIKNSSTLIYDTVPVVFQIQDNVWRANIPQQYYDSKVIYSLTLSDDIGNTQTIRDSVYIQFVGFGFTDPALVIGTATTTVSINPYYYYYNYSHSRNYYLDYEIDAQKRGGHISSIAFYNTNATPSTCNNVSFYLKAVLDSVITVASYVDPVSDGATLVWGPKTSITQQGWNYFVLDAPFYLPPNTNLLVYCNNQDGSYADNEAIAWQYTPTSRNGSFVTYQDAGWPPAQNLNHNGNRPNIQLNIYGGNAYPGNDIALSTFLYPVNDVNNICAQNYSPVVITMRNLGENDYDFSKDSIVLRLEVLDPLGNIHLESVVINTGIFESGMDETVELTPSLSLMYAGQYLIKAWVESPIDNIRYDDTITYIYISGKIGLPMDEGFNTSTLSSNLIASPIIGSDVWAPYEDPSSAVQPSVDPGMLRFIGSQGSMTQFTTRHLDLTGAINPTLDFWYYHDSRASGADRSYTDVNVIADDIAYTELTVFRVGTPHGWTRYTVDLSKYINAQCVYIQFKSMNKYGSQSVQYLDRILINSEQDLDIAEIIVLPEADVCDLKNKTVGVILSTTTNQAINLSNYTASLIVEIPGHSITPVPLQQFIAGRSSDTVKIPNINITTGITNIRAYLSSPVDANALNDTGNLFIDIRPSLSLRVNSLTGNINCFKKGTEVQQEILLQNTGNVDLSGIELVLIIRGDNTTETIKESRTIDLPAGKDTLYRFMETYSVPAEASYQVQVIAYLGCDSVLLNISDATQECADIHNLALGNLINPPVNREDVAGSTENIIVSITNESDSRKYENVNIIAVIEDENGQRINRLEVIPAIEANSPNQATFTEAYTVPNTPYSIRIYLNKVDNYSEDDTLFVQRSVTTVGITSRETANAFSLSQNIPNPANKTTRIDYSVPEAGEVVFHLHSISGQLLYSKTIEAAHGMNSIELNTSTFAAGLYFYSMEYKGQRHVKRMSVR
jgi:hypothetical protein